MEMTGKKIKIPLDQIQNYNQNELVEVPYHHFQEKEKRKIHQVVDEFNKKLMKNGMWGVNEESEGSK